MKYRINNKTKNKIIFNNLEEANTYTKRLKGLLCKKHIESDYALIIYPCKGIHTLFMKFLIDLIVLNKQKEVIIKYSNIEPFKIIKGTKEWYYVIECHNDKSEEVEVGDKLDW